MPPTKAPYRARHDSQKRLAPERALYCNAPRSQPMRRELRLRCPTMCCIRGTSRNSRAHTRAQHTQGGDVKTRCIALRTALLVESSGQRASRGWERLRRAVLRGAGDRGIAVAWPEVQRASRLDFRANVGAPSLDLGDRRRNRCIFSRSRASAKSESLERRGGTTFKERHSPDFALLSGDPPDRPPTRTNQSSAPQGLLNIAGIQRPTSKTTTRPQQVHINNWTLHRWPMFQPSSPGTGV